MIYRIGNVAPLICLLLSFASVSSRAQAPATGLPPLASFGGGPFDAINLANLNVHLAIPIFGRAGRGLPFNYSLSYDSLVWESGSSNGQAAWVPVVSGNQIGWGWRAVTEGATGYVTSGGGSTTWGCYQGILATEATVTFTNFNYHDPSGGIHPLPAAAIIREVSYSQNSPCGSGTTVYPFTNQATTDNSGYIVTSNSTNAVGPLTVNARGGLAILTPYLNQSTGAGSVTDANGNQISVNSSGQFTDTLDTGGSHVLTVSGSPSSGPMTYMYTAPNNTSVSVKVYYRSYTVQTCFEVSGIAEFPATQEYLVDHIELPDSTTYQFSYEDTAIACTPPSGAVTGRIVSVVLPTGGTIAYAYSSSNCTNCIMADGSPSTLSRTLSGMNINTGTWSYTRAVQQGQQLPQTVTSIADPAGNLTTLNFSGIYELNRLSYTGSSTLLNLEYVCYNNNYNGTQGPCSSASVALPIMRRDVYEVPNGIASLTAYRDENYDQYGNLVAQSDSAYGTNRSQPILRSTNVAMNGSLCSSYNICDRPQSIAISDGANHQKSYTTYAYDENNSPTHGSVTTINRSTSGTSSGPFLSSHFTYNGYGLVLTSQDVNNTVTTYTYNGTCNSAFPATISVPGDNGTTISYSYGYSCTGGVVTLITNNSTGYYAGATYSDPDFWRPALTHDFGGVPTYYNYYGVSNYGTSAATQPGWVESILSNNSGSAVDMLSTVDGLGRSSLVQQRETPNSTNWDTVEYFYNSSGGVAWITLPFVESAGETGQSVPAVNYRYDGLGRVTDIDNSYWGGADASYSYMLNDIKVTIPGSPVQSRQYEYDALGNLSSICEITSATGVGCGQNTAGTGYETSYSYDPLGNLWTVMQDVNQATVQTRNYTYDGLSRLLSEANPQESGAVHYTYDTDSTCGTSNGDMVKKVDNAGNVDCFYYDGLHRAYQAGGPTACRRWIYDKATVNGVQMSNALGQLAEVRTDNCGGTQYTDEGFSYDPDGRTTDVYESTPHSGGYYHVQASYWPDGSLETLNGNFSGVPSQTYGVDAEGGRAYSVMASSGQSPVTATAYNYLNQTTGLYQVTPVSGIAYGSGDSDAFAYTNLNQVSMATYKVGTSQIQHVLQWNPNGTLGSVAIADPLNSQNQQTCTYNYDAIGRVATLSQTQSAVNCVNGSQTVWKQDISYDAFGNLTKTGSSSWTPSYNPGTNQYVAGGGISYDANGNLTSDTFNAYTWDPNWGNVASVNGASLVFDALGKMVENTTTGTEYVYAPGGSQVFAVMNGQTASKVEYPLPGGGLAIYTGSTLTYARPDWLGSGRLVTNSTQGMVNDSAYAPFGEQYAVKNVGFAGFYAFTGQQQWTATGLDDFLFRRYHPVQGRWISPDPAGLAAVDIGDPQTWNRYVYVRNNPLVNIDVLGFKDDPCGDSGTDCFDTGDGGWDYGDTGDGEESGILTVGETTVTVIGTADPVDLLSLPGWAVGWNISAFQVGGATNNKACNAQPATGFVKAHQTDAATLAQQMSQMVGSQVPTNFVLAMAGDESTYGTSNIATGANNYFGLWAGAPGSTGPWSGNTIVAEFPAGNGFLISGRSYVQVAAPLLSGVTNVSNSTMFFTAMHKKFGVGSTPQAYVSKMTSVAAMTAIRMRCP